MNTQMDDQNGDGNRNEAGKKPRVKKYVIQDIPKSDPASLLTIFKSREEDILYLK